MENLTITKTSITWDVITSKFGKEIKRSHQILKHGNHISVSEIMYIEGEHKRCDLTHVPIELISKIKDLKESY